MLEYVLQTTEMLGYLSIVQHVWWHLMSLNLWWNLLCNNVARTLQAILERIKIPANTYMLLSFPSLSQLIIVAGKSEKEIPHATETDNIITGWSPKLGKVENIKPAEFRE